MYSILRCRFIAGGGYNAKHTGSGFRPNTSEGRELLKTIESNNWKHPSTGDPTYWPSDRIKQSGVVDFCVTMGITRVFAVAKSCFDLSSNHSSVLFTLTSHALNQKKQPRFSSRHINWDELRRPVNERLT
jgi:hypothetical protein